MTRPEITAKLSAMIEKKINPHNDPRIYWAKEVTFDYSTDHAVRVDRSEEHTSELQSRENLVCRLLLEKKKTEQE